MWNLQTKQTKRQQLLLQFQKPDNALAVSKFFFVGGGKKPQPPHGPSEQIHMGNVLMLLQEEDRLAIYFVFFYCVANIAK